MFESVTNLGSHSFFRRRIQERGDDSIETKNVYVFICCFANIRFAFLHDECYISLWGS